ncbi:pupal cuticle protein 36a-like [Galleria mellonella]|uniref:Pupal cuticle protein 36a-like n=1 Tax=Galleria mellonella TaxID=7137 RepID=A0A6J3C4A1_GALME|nr:pupal cuticle protein 36a-like [Galleria mellonella]
MKSLILLTVCAWASAAKLDNTYLPPSNAQSSGGSGNFLQAPTSGSSQFQGRAPFGNGNGVNGNNYARNNEFAPNGNAYSQNGNGFTQNGNSGQYDNGFGDFENRPERPQAAFERNAAILRQDNSNDGETYSYAYETENGIYAEESGVATNGVEAQGGFSYTGDDGQVYSIRYTADQNGFVPQGDHLPTPPPIPEEILRALEQNERDEAAGIFDDGSYNEAKYGSGDQYNGNYNGNSFNGNAYNNQNNYDQGDDDSVVTTSALFRNSPRNQNSRNFGANSPNSGIGGSNGVNNAYLPPVANNGNGRNGNGFGSRNRQPTYNERDGYRF